MTEFESPVFILGSPRSGTSAMCLALIRSTAMKACNEGLRRSDEQVARLREFCGREMARYGYREDVGYRDESPVA